MRRINRFFGNLMGRTNKNHPISRSFNTKIKKIELQKNCIYLNKYTTIEIDPVEGVRWLIVGDAGSGKSFCLGVKLNQFKNVLMFDPTGKFRDTLIEQEYKNKWEFTILSPKKNKGSFKINVSDLHPRILDSLFPRAEDTDKKRKQRQAIEHFIGLPNKTYALWEEFCEENKLDRIFTDMRWILSENDSALPILELCKGKTVIDCEGISIRNPCIGVFLQCLIGARSKLSKREALDPNNFIMVSLDEAQDYCRYQTPVGEAFATLNLQARKYGLGEILVGSAYDNLHPDVRAKSNMKFVFSSKGVTNQYKREGIDINLDDWDRLGKYECFIFSSDGKYNGFMSNDICYPDLYFKEVKKLNKIPDYVLKDRHIDFDVSSLFPR